MACSSPLKGWVGSNNGITFNKNASPTRIEMQVPCGQCWSCRLARSREWAVRLMKESSYWREDEQVFLTLTYDKENLPKDQSVKIEHFQKFMKDVRYHFSSLQGEKRVYKKLKYFHCGEYGETCKTCNKSYLYHPESNSGLAYTGCTHYDKQIGRPHYHAIIFGLKFDDMEIFKRTNAGEIIYKSEKLNTLWNKGFCSIGKVTFESCAYTARYIMKKINGDKAEENYKKIIDVDKDTGDIIYSNVKPEYISMSRRPAIAKQHLLDNIEDICKTDSVLIHRGNRTIQTKPSKYYMRLIKDKHPEAYETIKNKRKRDKALRRDDYTDERGITKERVKQLKAQNLSKHFGDFHNEN